MMQNATPKIYSVSEFVQFMREFLKEKIGHVIIQGEVSGFSISQNRFVFFDIKDKDSAVNCFLMKQNLKHKLEDGMEIKVLGIPQLFSKSGKFHIAITEIELVGEGALQKAYLALKNKLQAEGLFDEKHKRLLPAFPESIGIITSETAAAYTDVVRILKNRWSGLTIKLYPVKVQGLGAAKEIVSAFAYFNTHPIVDVLIVTRGGGSLEDLQAFNDEDVARAVFASKIPVICAVGHERDESLADYVADVRASTPSHAAERVIPDKREIKRRITDCTHDIERSYLLEIERKNDTVNTLVRRMTGRTQERIEKGLLIIENHYTRLRDMWERTLEETKSSIETMIRILNNTNPKNVLKKGYSVTWSSSKKIVKSIRDVTIGDELITQVVDGKITSKTSRKEQR